MLTLSEHDRALVHTVQVAIRDAISKADSKVAVAKRITVSAVRERNRGRAAAKKRHPFASICEASGLPLLSMDAALDELEPEKGYDGLVRWVCAKANNSGKRSCGAC